MMSCPELLDDGEAQWPVKLHLGAGGVYLVDAGTGYVNIDIGGLPAAHNPELVADNRTTLDRYYARLDGDWDRLPPARVTVVDQAGDIAALAYPRESVAKIVCIQTFEHLSPVRAGDSLGRWHTILRPGGVAVLSVPDMAETLDWLGDPARVSFATRHLRGSLRTQHSRHLAWYTAETLSELLSAYGFAVQTLPNFHIYPAIVLRATKR